MRKAILLVVLLLSAFVGYLVGKPPVREASAFDVQKYDVCHCEKASEEDASFQCQTQNLPYVSAWLHVYQHPDDYWGACEEPEPTYIGVCERNACVQVECDQDECVNECEADIDCEPEVTPTPTPTGQPTPTPTEEPKPEGCTENCNPPAPVCSADAVVKEPANPHVYRNGDDAIVKWVATGGNKANVYYKECSAGDWQHSLQTENTGYVEIHGLGSMDVCFAIEQVNDCGGGVVTAARSETIVDGPTSGWVLFR